MEKHEFLYCQAKEIIRHFEASMHDDFADNLPLNLPEKMGELLIFPTLPDIPDIEGLTA